VSGAVSTKGDAPGRPEQRFTERVREELAHVPLVGGVPTLREASGLLRVGGSLVLTGGGSGFGAVLRTSSGAVVRRLRAALLAMGGSPDVEVHQPGGLRRRASYRLKVGGEDAPVLAAMGLLDPEGRPAPPREPAATAAPEEVRAYLRGAVMAAASLSDPRASAHAEIPVPGEDTAEHLVALLGVAGAPGARAGLHGEGWRVVCKSGEQIGTLLATLGAHSAFLEWDDARLRRELRGAANRVANADRANLARAVGAAARHVEIIEQLVDAVGWEGLPEPLREVALARVTNPGASLAELGAILEPAVGKATVHRRLRALAELAEDLEGPAGAG
jgi:cell division protein WhiA